MLAVVLVAASGVLGTLNETILASLSPITEQLQTASTPILVEIDETTLQALGPPPWSPTVWHDLDQRLRAADVRGMVIDPAERLIEPHGSSFTNLWTPTIALPGVLVEPDSFGADPTVLRLPRSRGVLTRLPDERSTSDFLCAHARCPSGQSLAATTHTGTSIPRVSMGALLAGGVLLDAEPNDIVFIGITDPEWAQSLPVGVAGTQMTWPEAVVIAVATANSRSSAPVVSPLLLTSALMLTVISAAAIAHAERGLSVDAWMFVLPVVAAFLVISSNVLGLTRLSGAEFGLAAFAGPLAEVLRVRWRTVRFLRGASLRIARADLSTSWAESLQTNPQALLAQLASLTWNYLPTDRMFYLHDRGARRGFEVIGGFGLDATELSTSALGRAPLVRMARAGRCDLLFNRAETQGHLLPIHFNGKLLGYWVVAWNVGEPEPPVEVLVELIRWIEDALVPDDAPHRTGPRSWLQVDAELEAIEGSLERSATSREWQLKVLRDMGLPLATADRAGTFVFQNDAFRALFDKPPSSVRGLTWSVRGEVGLSDVMRHLFVDGQHLDLQLPTGETLRVAPIGESHLDGIAVYQAPDQSTYQRLHTPSVPQSRQQMQQPSRPAVIRLRNKAVTPGAPT
ncbi:MAG: PAS domain-containing protein [Kiritimatiellia bacterium]|jgi:PAS domain-containing protein